tara:strand:- start:151 stop:288 length:138 start_codon:yes stop_codon:yes gene_type:complete
MEEKEQLELAPEKVAQEKFQKSLDDTKPILINRFESCIQYIGLVV